MAAHSIVERKRALRSAALCERDSSGKEDLFALGGLAQARALEFAPYRMARAVVLYSPIQNEVVTETIRDDALNSGKRVFYPKLAGRNSVEIAQIDSAEDLVSGRFGILEAAGTASVLMPKKEATVVFVPGVVFDSAGNRLGRGIGWYDRLLRRIGRPAIFAALAYEFQIIADVPTEPWDEKMDYIITEARVIDCSKAPSQANTIS
jgi:5-formyltetrahydrofolate cyclo-ligase